MIRIFLITPGDINDSRCIYWSGTTYYLYKALRKRFQIVGIKALIPLSKRRFEKKTLVPPPDFTLYLNCLNPSGFRKPFAVYVDFVTSSYIRDGGIKPIRSLRRMLRDERKTYQKALVIFTFSEYARRAIIKEYDIASSKVITVGAGPNLRQLPSVDSKQFDGKTILFVGKDVQRKGGLVLLEAFKRVKEKVPDARLVMVSSKLQKHSHKRDLKEFGIYIQGLVDKRALVYWYRRASVFVMPSLFEPFGIVFLEAMAYKLPCIGTNICAIPEIIDDGRTGFLVKPGDADKLADKLIYLLAHKEQARRMGERGRKKIERYYLWDHTARRIERHMRRILGKIK